MIGGIFWVVNKKKFPVDQSQPGILPVRERGLEPLPSYRGLAPQASASTYSATRAGDEMFVAERRMTLARPGEVF